MPQQPSPKNKAYSSFDDFADAGVVSAVSHRQSGNMSSVYGDTASSLENRRAFLNDLGIDYKSLVSAKQIHGNNIKYARAVDKGSGALSYDNAIADTDALVTDEKDLPLAVFTADCLSVFLYDAKTPAIGLVHAGWRSSKENITARTIRLMGELFKTRQEDLRLAFGPGIRDCCYEVEEEFKKLFSGAVIERAGRLYLDLASENKKQALECGVRPEHIFDDHLCTFCRNDLFYSFRKEGKDSGRMISLFMLK